MEFPFFFTSKTVKYLKFPFVLKMIKNFQNFLVFFTLVTKKVIYFGGISNEKCE